MSIDFIYFDWARRILSLNFLKYLGQNLVLLEILIHLWFIAYDIYMVGFVWKNGATFMFAYFIFVEKWWSYRIRGWRLKMKLHSGHNLCYIFIVLSILTDVSPFASNSITKNRVLQVDFSKPFQPSIAQANHCISFLGTWGS